VTYDVLGAPKTQGLRDNFRYSELISIGEVNERMSNFSLLAFIIPIDELKRTYDRHRSR
jgi:hypothetical protein